MGFAATSFQGMDLNGFEWFVSLRWHEISVCDVAGFAWFLWPRWHTYSVFYNIMYIYITERWATFVSVCRTGRQRLDERGVSPRGERHFCSVCRATWGYLWERTAATGIFENLISGAIWGYLWEPATGILGNRISGAIWGYLHKKIICIKKCSDVLIYIYPNILKFPRIHIFKFPRIHTTNENRGRLMHPAEWRDV